MPYYVDKFELDNEEILIKDSDAQNRIDEIVAPKVWLFVGDSYNEDNLFNDTGNGWGNRINALLGTNFSSIAKGNTAFGKPSPNNFINVISDNINAVDLDNTTDILVAGGYNDWEQQDTNIISGISDFVAYVDATFTKNVKVHVAMIGRSKLGDRNTNLRTLPVTYARGCSLAKASYINNAQYLGRDRGFMKDTIHPNADGLDLIAKGLAQYILGGDLISFNNNRNCSLESYNGCSPSGALYCQYNNNIAQLTPYNMRLSFSADRTIPHNDWEKVLKINNVILGNDQEFTVFRMKGFARVGSGFKHCDFNLKIHADSNGDCWLSIRADYQSNTDGGWDTITTDLIYFDKFADTISFMTDYL